MLPNEKALLPNSILLADEFYREYGIEDLGDSRRNFIRDLNAVVLSSYVYWTQTNEQPIQPNEVAYYMGAVFSSLVNQVDSYDSNNDWLKKTEENLKNLTTSFELGIKDKLAKLKEVKNANAGVNNEENKV